jgi:hypothetical protein
MSTIITIARNIDIDYVKSVCLPILGNGVQIVCKPSNTAYLFSIDNGKQVYKHFTFNMFVKSMPECLTILELQPFIALWYFDFKHRL